MQHGIGRQSDAWHKWISFEGWQDAKTDRWIETYLRFHSGRSLRNDWMS
jgi:hypothetical protein